MRLVIAMPVYEDWEAALKVCQGIDLTFSGQSVDQLSIIFIDDGSSSPCPSEISTNLKVVDRVSVLVLRRNLGHQRAIAVGLAYLHRHWSADALVVMDADGEDRPQDIPRLLNGMAGAERLIAVFAERRKRLETTTFRSFYHLYRGLHLLLAGHSIRIGNFSAMPWDYLDRLVAYPELWNHYASTVLKARLAYRRLPCDRATRIAGRSRMNFTSLVVHGMSALFANQEVVGTRLLMAIIAVTLCLLAVGGAVVGVKLFTHLGIPGWATFTLGLLLIMVGQALTALVLLVFSVVMNRSQLGFLPLRDYPYFILREVTLYSR